MFEKIVRIRSGGKQNLRQRKAGRSGQTGHDNRVHPNPQPLEEHTKDQNAKDHDTTDRIQLLLVKKGAGNKEDPVCREGPGNPGPNRLSTCASSLPDNRGGATLAGAQQHLIRHLYCVLCHLVPCRAGGQASPIFFPSAVCD